MKLGKLMTLKCCLKWQCIIALPASQGAIEFPFQVHSHFLAMCPHGLPWREKEKQRDNKTSPGGNKGHLHQERGQEKERWVVLRAQHHRRRWVRPSSVRWPLHQHPPSSRPEGAPSSGRLCRGGFRRNQIRGWWAAWGREMSPGRNEMEPSHRLKTRGQLYKS